MGPSAASATTPAAAGVITAASATAAAGVRRTATRTAATRRTPRRRIRRWRIRRRGSTAGLRHWPRRRSIRRSRSPMELRRRPRRWSVTRCGPGFTRRTVAGKARARYDRRAAPCPCSIIAGAVAIAFVSEALMRIHGTRRKRAQRHDCASCNRHMRVPVSRGQARIPQRIVPVHRDHRNRPVSDWSTGPVRRKRSLNRPIPSGRMAYIGAAIETDSPPRPAAAHSRRPSPTEAVVEIPRSALVRHVSPRIA